MKESNNVGGFTAEKEIRAKAGQILIKAKAQEVGKVAHRIDKDTVILSSKVNPTDRYIDNLKTYRDGHC